MRFHFILHLFSLIFSITHIVFASDNIEIPIISHGETISYLKALCIDEVNKVYVVNDCSQVQENGGRGSAITLLAPVGSNHYLMVDTPYTNIASESLWKWMKETLYCEKVSVINTHHHIDCLGGNGYFNNIGMKTYASTQTLDCFERDDHSTIGMQKVFCKSHKDLKENFGYVAPNGELENLMTKGAVITRHLDDSTIPVMIMYPGEAHAPDNIVVYLKEYNVLFGGVYDRLHRS